MVNDEDTTEIDDDYQDKLFENIFIGIHITDDNNSPVTFNLFIGFYGMEDGKIDIYHYKMDNINFSETAKDVIIAALTINELDHLLFIIKAEQSKIIKKLIFNL